MARIQIEGGAMRFRITATTVLLLALTVPGITLTQAVTPTNSAPNPYRTIENFFKLPDGRMWGSTSSVYPDIDGHSIWAAERCGANTCLNSPNLDTVMKFDETGKLVRSFGAGMMIFPHGIFVDKDGNVWMTDGRDNLAAPARGATAATPSPAKVIGHQVFKFSPDGKLLLTLGKPGGNQPDKPADPASFYQPNAVLVLPNGDILVSEGHGGANSRLIKFTKDGKFIKEIGRKGTAHGEFDQPHTLALDSRGRIFVGDRANNRIQILDQDGNFLEEWFQFSRPSGIYIDKQDNIYVADSESGSVNRTRTDWKRGIRIGRIADGIVTAFIPDLTENPPSTSGAEGVAVDAGGNIYGAEVGAQTLKKYVKK
jgi:hypothetical protein